MGAYPPYPKEINIYFLQLLQQLREIIYIIFQGGCYIYYLVIYLQG